VSVTARRERTPGPEIASRLALLLAVISIPAPGGVFGRLAGQSPPTTFSGWSRRGRDQARQARMSSHPTLSPHHLDMTASMGLDCARLLSSHPFSSRLHFSPCLDFTALVVSPCCPTAPTKTKITMTVGIYAEAMLKPLFHL